jgi:E3 ubiquitin-protein ligase DOA10
MYQTLNNDNDEIIDNAEIIGDVENDTRCCICFEINDQTTVNIQNIKNNDRKCKCSAIVHVECITKWYMNKNILKCIICNSTIKKISKQRTPQPLPPVQTAVQTTTNHTRIPCKALCIIVIIFLILIIAFPDVLNLTFINGNSDNSDNRGNRGNRGNHDNDHNSDDQDYILSLMMGQY